MRLSRFWRAETPEEKLADGLKECDPRKVAAGLSAGASPHSDAMLSRYLSQTTPDASQQAAFNANIKLLIQHGAHVNVAEAGRHLPLPPAINPLRRWKPCSALAPTRYSARRKTM